MPHLRRRRLPSSLASLALALLALLVGGVGAAQADPIASVALQSATTGTAPWDAAPGPGQDAAGTDDQVRSYDSIAYAWAINVNSSVGATESFTEVTFTQTLPAGLSWSSATVPLYCKGAGWSIAGQTLTCVYVPSGGGHTGTTLNITLTAQAGGQPDGTVATAAPGSTTATVTAGAVTSPPDAATAPAVTIRSLPWLDMFKQTPAASIAPPGDPLGAGYYLAYPIGLQLPADRQSTYGIRGFLMPTAPATFTDDLSQISAGAQFVSCSGAVSCVAAGQSVAVTVATLPTDPAADGKIATGTIRVFVPQADVAADADGNLDTRNVLTTLTASAPAAGGGTVAATGDLLPNNTVDYNLITTGGSGNVGFNKRFLAADGTLLPTQTVANDGNGQVVDGQDLLAELRIANTSATAPAPTPGVCDVWDATRIHLAGSAAHGGAAVWAQTVPGGWTAGADYVVEYSTQAAATGDDATRWGALQARSACTDASDAWTTAAPADLATVTKVRIRLLHDMDPAAATVVFRLNLVVADPTDGDVIANFLGVRIGPTWSPSTYAPATNAGNQRGDRVRVNGITVRVRKRAANPSTSFGAPATIQSGDAIQFELTPTVTAVDVGHGAPVAHDVVVRDRLPLGLVYDTGRPTTPSGLTPVVTLDGAGRQVLTWTIPTLTAGSEPTITYWTQSSATTIGTRVNEAIIASPSDVGSLSSFPSSPGADQHYSAQTVNLQSPGGVRISKLALQTVVEPLDPLAFQIEYANLTATTATNVDIIDVLPFTGDGLAAGAVPGRNPATAWSGALPVDTLDVSHGETIRYTDADPLALYASSSPATLVDAAYGALPSGFSWCVVADFGTPGCPVDLGHVTGVRILRASLASGDSAQLTLHLAPTGNRSADVYSNTAAIRYGTGNLGALSNVATSRVVASSVGDFVWVDANANGIQDAGEAPVAGVPITLTGTDKHGRAISVATTTDATGRYTFTSSSQAGQDAHVLDLVSGSYTVTFHREGLPPGMVFTTRHAGGSTAATDSDADPATGQAPVVLPDPSPTGVDGQDLTIDAGIVAAPAAGAKKPGPAEDAPTPDHDPAEPKDPTPPTAPRPRPPTTTTAAGKPKLGVKERASRGSIAAGETVTFSIRVRNAGRGPARDTVVCTTPGAGLTVAEVPAGARFRHGSLCWALGTVQAGETRTVSVRMRAAQRGGKRAVRARNAVRVSARGVRTRRAAPAAIAVKPGGVVAGRHPGVTG